MPDKKISCCIIVRDGEETLQRCLDSVKPYVDEIMIGVDTRTVDKTRKIAGKFFNLIWYDDFALARNTCAARAHNDIILVLDADDYLEPGKEAVLRQAVTEGDGLRFTVQTSKFTHVASIRCYNRKTARYIYAVHEYLEFLGENPKTVDVPIKIFHERASVIIEPGRNLKILERELEKQRRYLFYHGKECYEIGRHEDALNSLKRYLDVSKWVAEKCEALVMMAKCKVSLGFTEDAKDLCLQTIKIEPNFAPAHNYLGQIAMVQGDYHSAVMWFENALKVQDIHYVFDERMDTKFNCYGNLIIAYHKVGDVSAARMAVIKAQQISPDSEWIKDQVKICDGENA